VPTPIDSDLHEFNHWIFRFRPSFTSPCRLLVMLHGWTGDENSMWVFARKLPQHLAILSPRGLFPAQGAGYSWREIKPDNGLLPGMDDLHPSASALIDFIDGWTETKKINADQFDLIGFSQGAALAFAVAILYPERIRSLAALSGFLPKGGGEMLTTHTLAGKKIFISHGRQDEMVPVNLSRRAANLLEISGAKVTYCETDGGHKVSVECFSRISDLFG
jgi:phospholipase/carboxylesterase